MIVAQQFTAGLKRKRDSPGSGRLNSGTKHRSFQSSVFTDFVSHSCHPSDESLGYFQSSAKRGLAATLFMKSWIAGMPNSATVFTSGVAFFIGLETQKFDPETRGSI
jgi:hypothetical protein